MKLIYVGSSRPEHITQEYLKKGSSVNFAGMTLQTALLDGLYFYDKKLQIISAWDISPFPKLKQIYFPPENVFFKETDKHYKFVGAINLPIYNLFSKFLRVRRELKRQIRNCTDNAVIVYETHTPFLLAVASLRNKIKKTVVIVPDLPEYMHGGSNPIRRFFKWIDHKVIHHCLKKFDGYVLLSEPMREKLPKSVEKYIVMEGIFNPEFDDKPVEKEAGKVIMYTGGVYRHRGTHILLEAFMGIKDPNYKLWIRGNGDMVDEIKEMAEKDHRITYFEPMKRKDLLELEKRATVMVNTTPPQDFTKYFFPSKNMEFLASGTPTVMFKLGCIPKEYDSYLFYADRADVESLRDKLIEVCEMNKEDRSKFGEAAKNFILKEKNPIVQCGRIVEFINKL